MRKESKFPIIQFFLKNEGTNEEMRDRNGIKFIKTKTKMSEVLFTSNYFQM